MLKTEQIEVQGHPFTVEVAETPTERAKGLSNRKSLPVGTGMLFKMDGGPASFHMKNTLIPLDILFLDGDGTIIKNDMMQPHIGRSYCDGDIHGVLEFPMGTCNSLGIGVGDKMTIPRPDQNTLLNDLIREILLTVHK